MPDFHARHSALLIAWTIAVGLSLCTGAEPPATQPAPSVRMRLGNLGLRVGRPWAFTPDGKGLFTLREKSIELWDAASGRSIRTFTQGDRIFYAARSGDGSAVAGCSGNEIIVWNAATGEKIATLSVAEGWALSPALSHDGKLIAWIMPGFKGLTVHNVASGRKIATFSPDPKEGESFRLLFAPDGKTLAEGASANLAANPPKSVSTVRIWDIAARKLRLQSKFDDSGSPSLAFSPDGKRLVGGAHGLHVWEVASGKEIAKTPVGNTGFPFVAFMPDGKLVALGVDVADAWTAERFTLAGDSLQAAATVALFHSPAALSDDGREAAYGDVAAGIFDTQTAKTSGVNTAPITPTKLAAFLGNRGQVITICEDGSAFIWQASTGALVNRFEVPVTHATNGIGNSSMCLSADGATLIVTDGQKIYGYSTSSGGQLYSTGPVAGRQISLLALSPDGNRVAGSGRAFDMKTNWAVYAWDAKTGGPSQFERGVSAYDAASLCWSADSSTIALGCFDGTVHLFSGATGSDKTTLRMRPSPPNTDFNSYPDPEQSISSIDIAPDGRLLAAVNNNGDLALWEPATGRLVRMLPRIDPSIPRVRFDPRGFALATLNRSGTIDFWEVSTGVKIATLSTGHPIESWNFSPDGAYIVTGGNPSDNAVWKSPLAANLNRDGNPAASDNKAFEKLWAELADRDAARACQAGFSLAGSGKPALHFLAERLTFAPPPAEVRTKVQTLIHNLSADNFKTRRAAEHELQDVSGPAHPLLIASQKHPDSIDARMALGRVLAETPRTADVSPDEASYLRAIAAVEQIGGPEAMTLLEKVWETATSLPAATEARAALARLKAKESAAKP